MVLPMDDTVHEGTRKVYVDSEGREFHYIYFDNGRSSLGVHFSAFFGDWGSAPKYRETFGGYFHRLKMLSSDISIDWLFLCDAYGADANGTYYIGKDSDRFVERAVTQILKDVGVGGKYPTTSVVTIGSSMGATGALRMGINLSVKGIVALSPHIDLDISAKLQNRERHVSWIVSNGQTQSPKNYPVTREINLKVDEFVRNSWELPNLFVQSCRDDFGVHYEQVIPFVKKWAMSGQVVLDERRLGGHTSEYATRSLLLDVVHSLLEDRVIKTHKYKWAMSYRPYGYLIGALLRIRRLLGNLRRVLSRPIALVP